MEQLGSHWTDFQETLHFQDFSKKNTEISSSIKSDKNNWYFTWRPMYVYGNISFLE